MLFRAGPTRSRLKPLLEATRAEDPVCRSRVASGSEPQAQVHAGQLRFHALDLLRFEEGSRIQAGAQAVARLQAQGGGGGAIEAGARQLAAAVQARAEREAQADAAGVAGVVLVLRVANADRLGGRAGAQDQVGGTAQG